VVVSWLWADTSPVLDDGMVLPAAALGSGKNQY